eukprot:4472000-Amphidinium_carterae.1
MGFLVDQNGIWGCLAHQPRGEVHTITCAHGSPRIAKLGNSQITVLQTLETGKTCDLSRTEKPWNEKTLG